MRFGGRHVGRLNGPKKAVPSSAPAGERVSDLPVDAERYPVDQLMQSCQLREWFESARGCAARDQADHLKYRGCRAVSWVKMTSSDLPTSARLSGAK